MGKMEFVDEKSVIHRVSAEEMVTGQWYIVDTERVVYCKSDGKIFFIGSNGLLRCGGTVQQYAAVTFKPLCQPFIIYP